MVAYHGGQLLTMGLLKYPRGLVVVQDLDERVHVSNWPEDADNSELIVDLFPLDEDTCEVSSQTAHALRRIGVEPTLADIVEQMVELGWAYTLELRYDGEDGPLHHASIATGSGTRWGVVASVADVHNVEAVALAFLSAVANHNRHSRRVA